MTTRRRPSSKASTANSTQFSSTNNSSNLLFNCEPQFCKEFFPSSISLTSVNQDFRVDSDRKAASTSNFLRIDDRSSYQVPPIETNNFKDLLQNKSANVGSDPVNMSGRDRSHEFYRIVRSQQGNLVNGVPPSVKGKASGDLQVYSNFMHKAKLIGRNISSTYAKLEKLMILAKKRSLFDDSQDHEIQELTGIIRHDLTSLTKQLDALQASSRISPAVNGSSQHLQKHSTNLVSSLQTKVASMTQKFRDVLEVRTENLKKQAERREQFTTTPSVVDRTPQGAMGPHQGSFLIADEAAAIKRSRGSSADGGAVAIDMGGGGTVEAPGGSAYQQQLQLMEEQGQYLQAREDTMKTIESTIVELGQMFTHLAGMVKEQEELVHRIDSNVDHTEMNVEAAHTELLKYFRSISSNRWLMVKVFGIFIVFFMIFVVFMA